MYNKCCINENYDPGYNLARNKHHFIHQLDGQLEMTQYLYVRTDS